MKNLKFSSLILFATLIPNLLISQSENCLEFDGIDDYVFIGDVNNLGTSDFTVEAWININDADVSENGNKIITKGLTGVGTPSNAGFGLRASRTTPDELEFQIGHSDGSNVKVKYFGITPHTWYHVAGVRSEKKLFLYLNGEIVGTDSTEVIYDVNTNIPMVIGAIHKLGILPIDEFMDGKIDEVRIWDRALTDSDIKMNMNCAIFDPQPNLLAVFNLNSESGFVAIDSSGYGNHGSLENGPLWVSSPVALNCMTSTVEIKNGLINVYPNPFESEIHFNIGFNGYRFRIFDLLGKLVRSGKIENNNIFLDNLVSGSYLLEVFENENRIEILL